MTKISQYPYGGSKQNSDRILIERAGNNYHLLGSDFSGGGYPFNGRLTLETGVPVSTTDQTAKTTLYLTQYDGNKISVYNGSGWDELTLSSDISVSLAGLTAGLPYDAWVYNNASTPALELGAWTNTTTRAVARSLVNGIYVKSSDTSRRYAGSICIVATGQCEDSVSRRMVYNHYNRVLRTALRAYIASHTYTTAAWRPFNNSQASSQFEFVVGDAQQLAMIYRANITTAAAGAGIGWAINSTTAPGGSKGEQFNNAGDAASADNFLANAGYNYFLGLEYGAAGFTPERISTLATILM